MRYALLFLCLIGAAAAAEPSSERRDQPWVCVATEDRQWRCGRGAQAPEPRPLPPAPPPDAPPPGYEPLAGASGLPDYLRDSIDPAERPDGDSPPAAEEAPEASATAEAERSREPDESVAARESVPETEAAPQPEPAPETTDAASAAEPAPGTTRYGIQLIAGRDRTSVEAYRDTPGLDSLDVYRRTWEDAGGVWHVLMAGRFQSVSAARQALNELPEDLKQAGAWVRPLDQLDIPSDHPRNPRSD